MSSSAPAGPGAPAARACRRHSRRLPVLGDVRTALAGQEDAAVGAGVVHRPTRGGGVHQHLQMLVGHLGAERRLQQPAVQAQVHRPVPGGLLLGRPLQETAEDGQAIRRIDLQQFRAKVVEMVPGAAQALVELVRTQGGVLRRQAGSHHQAGLRRQGISVAVHALNLARKGGAPGAPARHGAQWPCCSCPPCSAGALDSTTISTGTSPALRKCSVSGKRSPATSGCFRPISIRW